MPGGVEGVFDARQHKVQDVGRQVVFARRDKDFRAGDLERPVRLLHRARLDQAQIRAALRFGQAHRARPFAGNQLRQVGIFLRIRAVDMHRVIRAMRQSRIHCERHIGGAEHFRQHSVQHDRHAKPAVFRITGKTRQPRRAELVIRVLEPLGRRHRFRVAVVMATLAVADGIQGEQDILGQLSGLRQKFVDGRIVDAFEIRHRFQLRHVQHFVQDKAHIIEGGLIAGHI